MENDEQVPLSISGNIDGKDADFVLRLYITGASPNSLRAVENIQQICKLYLKNNYQLEIIDVYQQASIAEQEQIVALPLLIKVHPLPKRRFIGDMSNTNKVLNGLGISAGV